MKRKIKIIALIAITWLHRVASKELMRDMGGKMKSIIRVKGLSFLAFLFIFLMVQGKVLDVRAAEASLQYRTYVESLGWGQYASEGASGSEGKSLRMEAIEMKLLNHPGSGVKYSVHIQNIGWQEYKADGITAGAMNQSKRIEAIKIELTGSAADEYDIYYRGHVQNFGWLDWTKNGHASGSEEYAYRLESVEVKLVPKGAVAPGKTTAPFKNFYGNRAVTYESHIRNLGWVEPVSDGAVSGKGDSGLRMEAIKIMLSPEVPSGSVAYSVHASNIGWMDEVKDGALAGTEGESRRLEALTVKLTGSVARSYGITYRTHVEGKGWTAWSKDGEVSGTTGESRMLEAMEVKLYSKVTTIEPEDPVVPDPEDPVIPDPVPEKVLDHKVYRTTVNLNLRETPSATGRLLTTMAKGNLVKVYEITNGWAKLDFSGTMGYASATYLEFMYDVYLEPKPMIIEINGMKSSYKNENITGSGLAVAYSGVKEVKVLLDGTVIASERYEDAAAAGTYPDYKDTALAGYRFSIDPQNVSGGTHKLTVVTLSNYGQSFSKTVEFSMEKAPPKLTLSGLSSGDPMPVAPKGITGLALYDSGVSAVNYYVNGTLAGTAAIGLASDGSLYPDYSGRNTAGYSFTLDPALLNKEANTLRVQLVGKDGATDEQSVIILGSSVDRYVFEDYPNTFKYYVDKEYINAMIYGTAGTELYSKVRTNMEPGNFIYDSVNKYLFMDLSYNASDYTVSVEVLDAMLAGRGILSGKGQTFLDAAIAYKVNPFYLVAHSLLETGNGGSALANGQKIEVVYSKLGDINSPTTPVPEIDKDKLVYNVYGIGAYNSNALLWGSQYAYKEKWFSVEEAITGGASWISRNYIHRVGGAQNTLYKMRFNLASNMTHQYATDIEWAKKQASRIQKQFDAMGVDAQMTFYIPRFKK